MRELRGIVSGPVVIDQNTHISGIMNGDILLEPGANAVVSGMIDGMIVRR